MWGNLLRAAAPLPDGWGDENEEQDEDYLGGNDNGESNSELDEEDKPPPQQNFPSGMFMGRLTQLIAKVAGEEEKEEEGNGWEEDEADFIGDDDDNGGDEKQNAMFNNHHVQDSPQRPGWAVGMMQGLEAVRNRFDLDGRDAGNANDGWNKDEQDLRLEDDEEKQPVLRLEDDEEEENFVNNQSDVATVEIVSSPAIGWAVGGMTESRDAAVRLEDDDDNVNNKKDENDGWNEENDGLEGLEEFQMAEANEEGPVQPPICETKPDLQHEAQPPIGQVGAPLVEESENGRRKEGNDVLFQDISSSHAPQEENSDDDIAFSAIHRYGSELSQPLNTLITEIRLIDSHDASANPDTPTALLSSVAFSRNNVVVLQPLPNIDEEAHSVTFAEPQPSPSLISNSMSADEYSASVRHQVDSVLNEIEQQERASLERKISAASVELELGQEEPQPLSRQQQQQDPTLNPEEQHSQNEASADHEDDDDVLHHDQAIQAIQQEMDDILQNHGGVPPPLPVTPLIDRFNLDGSVSPSVIIPSLNPTTPIVDHTPFVGDEAKQTSVDHTLCDPSLQPQFESEDLTRDGVDGEDGAPRPLNGDNDEDVYDDENEDNFGLVVDHTPVEVGAVDATVSMVVQASELLRDQDADDEMDETVPDDDGGWDDDDGLNALEEVEEQEDLIVAPPEPALVDHTPALEDLEVSAADIEDRNGDPSVAVLRSEGGTTILLVEAGDAGADVVDEDDPREYGPVVDHLPVGDEVSVSVATTAHSMAVNLSELEKDICEDDLMDDDDEEEELTPLPIPVSVVQDEWDGEEGNSVDQQENDQPDDQPDVDLQSSMPRLEPYSISHQHTEDHVVDHTPSELGYPRSSSRSNPSVAVLAAPEDLTRDTGELGSNDDNVYDDENEMSFCPVVDHTPQFPADAHSTAAGTAQAVDDNASGLSTIAGATTLDDGGEGDTIGEDALLEDIGGKPEESTDNKETMVDHLPFEMREFASQRHVSMDPSVAVLASIDEHDSAAMALFGQEDNLENYGPMVDHTPTTPAHPPPPRSDSVRVQLDDAADEETLDAADTYVEDGDTVNEELPAVRDAVDTSVLVDRVPPRPESRFGDASTLVAADPSEILSGVDDMLMEEEGGDLFGPVVDQTPAAVVPVLGAIPSGAGSTIAFAPPSVGADDFTGHGDDLDDDEEDNDDDPDLHAWNQHEQPAAPNPQSDDEPVAPPEPPQEQQVVDFLPQPQAERHDHHDGDEPNASQAPSTEASSEYAVGGTQSLLQPEDPQEGDFGPVVDQLPQMTASASVSSTVITLVTASEIGRLEKEDATHSSGLLAGADDEEKVVVDHVPTTLRTIRANVDSLATVGQSQFTEEDEEEETDSKFGPVVDHLPTPRPVAASSMAGASRGGSTVDALGTVSEGSDAGETDGWAEDEDVDDAATDVTDRVSQPPKGLFRRSSAGENNDRQNISVRFDSSVRDPVDGLDDSSKRETTNDSLYYDACASMNETTQYFDPRPPSASFAEAETPPSTPHHRPATARHIPSTVDSADINTPWLNVSDVLHDEQPVVCSPCRQSNNGECPCVRKILNVSRQEGTLFGTLIAADGQELQVNFGQLLQDEMTKRRLLEEEAKALRQLVDSKTHSEELFNAQRQIEELQRELCRLRQASLQELEDANRRIEGGKTDHDNARQEQEGVVLALQQELSAHALRVGQLETQIATKEDARQTHVSVLRKELADVQAEKDEVISALRQELAGVEEARVATACDLAQLVESSGTERDKNAQTCRDLASRVEQLVAERDGVEESKNCTIKALEIELASAKAELDLALQEHVSADAELMPRLREEKDAILNACRDLESKLSTLKAESKIREIEQTQAISVLESRIQESDEARRDIEIALQGAALASAELKAELEGKLNQAEQAAQQLRHEFAGSTAALKKDLAAAEARHNSLESDLAASQLEAKALRDALSQQNSQGYMALEDAESKCRGLEQQLTNLRVKLTTTEKQNSALDHDVTSLKSQLAEKDDELSALFQRESQGRAVLEATESRCRDLEQQLTCLRDELTATEKLSNEVDCAVTSLELEKEEIKSQLAEKETELSALFQRDSQSRLALETAESKYRELEHQLTCLRDKLTATEKQKNEMDCAITSLELENDEIKSQLARKGTELSALSRRDSQSRLAVEVAESKYRDLEHQLTCLRDKSTATEKQKNEMDCAITSLELENDEIKSQLAEKETELSALSQRDSQSRLALETAESKYRDLEHQLTCLRDKLTATEKLNNEMDCAITSLELENGDIKSQLAEKETELSALTERDSKSSLALETAESKYRDLEHQLTFLRDKLTATEKQKNEMDCAITSLELENDEIKSQLAEKETELRALSQRDSQSRLALETAESKYRDLEHQLTCLRDKLTATEKQKNEMDCAITSLELENDEIKSQLAEKETEISALTQRDSQSRLALETADSKYRDLEHQLTCLRDKLTATEKHKNEMDCAITSLELEKDEIKSQLAEREAELQATRRAALQHHSGALQTANAKCQELQEQLVVMQKKLMSAEERNSELDCTVTSLEMEKEEVQAQLSEKESEYETETNVLRHKIQQAETRNQDMQHDMAKAKAQHAARLADMERKHKHELEERVAELERQVANLDITLRDKDAEISAAEADQRAVDEKMLSVAAECDALRAQMQYGEDTNATMKCQINKLETDLAGLAAERDALKTQLLQSTQAVATLESLKGQESDKLAMLTAERDSLREELTRIQEMAASSQRHIDEQDLEQQELETKRDAEIANLFEKTRQLHASLNAKEGDILFLKKSLSHMEHEKDTVIFSQAQMQKEAQLLREQIAASETNLSRLRQDYERVNAIRIEQEEAVTAVEGELKAALRRLHQLEAESSGWSASLDHLMAEKASMEASLIQALSESNARFEHHARESESHISRLQQECEELRRQRQEETKIHSAFQEMQLTLQQTYSERDALSEENEELLVQLGLLKEHMDQQDEHLAELERSFSQLVTAINEVSRQNAAVTSRNDPLADNADVTSPLEMSIASLRRLGVCLAELESKLRSSQVETEQMVNKERQGRVSSVGQLEAKCRHLEQDCLSKQAEVERLLGIEKNSFALQSNLAALQTQLDQLQAEYREHKQIAAKDDQALEVLNQRVRELEQQNLAAELWLADAEKSWKRLLDAARQEYEEQLAAITADQSLEKRCQELEQECTNRQEQLDELLQKQRVDDAEMEARLELLQTELRKHQDVITAKDAAIAASRKNDQVVSSLNQRVRELEAELSNQRRQHELELTGRFRELEASHRESQMRALESENSLKRYQDKVKQEREQERIQTQAKLQSLQSQLDSAKTALQSKDTEIQKLAAEIREQTDLSISASVENQDDIAALRSHIVSLATALERSEMQRAEAMDTLTLERQAHADALRKLGESVKRYFSSVRSSCP